MWYEWDETKGLANLRKHGVSFEEAVSVFEDRELQIAEDDGDWSEQRFRAIGWSERKRQLLVVFCERDWDEKEEVIRIISARELTRSEQRRLVGLRRR